MKGLAVRRLAGLVTLALGATMVLVVGVLPAAANHDVVITQYEGNPTCGDFDPNWTEWKLEPVASGDYEVAPGQFIEVAVSDGPDGQVFDWASNFTINAVFVKGGPMGLLYTYPGGATEGTGLHAPINDSNEKFYGLSHISFCWQKPTTTTRPDSSTTSTTTSTTRPDSSTTTVPSSTSSSSTTTSTTTTSTTTTVPSSSTTTSTTTTTQPPTTQPPTTTGSIPFDSVPTTLAAEVLGLQVSSTAAATAQTLPFTGQSSGYLAGLGVALVGMGGVLMAGARRKEEGSEVVLAGWSSRI